jgi:hypothetical protein
MEEIMMMKWQLRPQEAEVGRGQPGLGYTVRPRLRK